MDELEISGKRYLSSKRAAKEHRYHIDYIGQLIRAGKVTGKKVGRSWYVEEVSLKTYLKQEAGEKGLPPVVEAVVEEISSPVVEEAVEVEPQPVEELIPVVEEKVIEPVYVAPVTVAYVPEKKVEPEERKVFFSVPEKVVSKPSTLTYIADDEPLLPVLEGRNRSNADFVVPMRRVTEEQIYEEPIVTVEEAPVRVAKHSRKAFGFPRVQVLAVLGVIVLALVALASSMLASSIKVVDGQPASAGYIIK